ncbi:hypothetical protein [Treponema zioleckii]|nr:hypothetical protein [Treponema zioleckii]
MLNQGDRENESGRVQHDRECSTTTILKQILHGRALGGSEL